MSRAGQKMPARDVPTRASAPPVPADPRIRTCLACKTAGQALFAVFFAPPSSRLTGPTAPDCTANRVWAKRARPQHAKHVPESVLGPSAWRIPILILTECGMDSRWPQNPFWGLPHGGFPSSFSPSAEWIPPGVQESGSGTFLRAPLRNHVPTGSVDLPRVILRTASGKREPDPTSPRSAKEASGAPPFGGAPPSNRCRSSCHRGQKPLLQETGRGPWILRLGPYGATESNVAGRSLASFSVASDSRYPT